ncbi:MAG: branched-chain amino acid ABC transporter permease [Alphaproteobacteria bacterium]|jgi:branched-chain amino acid transport system permease protein|nr:branched-chain amino acid ABC transporter permease [Alphaproteobacteria bacterium]MDP6813506.1 branched-chain amino acid ABC transporter permease [Alphaproteobacteria bacterium]
MVSPAFGRAVAVAAFAIAVALPLWVEPYTLYLFTMPLIYAIAIIGLNLLSGFNGQFSLGHSAFFALGAYTSAMAMAHLGLSYYATLPLAALLPFVVGYLFGFPALRLGLVYMALATWALAVAIPQALKSSHLEAITGGVQGIYLDRPEVPFGLPIGDDTWWHYVTLAVLVPALWLAGNMVRHRHGRALTAIRDNQTAAMCNGIATTRYKTLAFGISAAYAGIAGSLHAVLTEFIAPDSYTLGLSILLLIGAVVGGINTIWGAVLGGLLIQFFPLIAGGLSKGLAFPMHGFLLLALMLFMPTGIAGLLRRIAGRSRPNS